jgi:hypothetical protein
MSTPVQITPPPSGKVSRKHHKRVPSGEIQERMQLMIRLQYEQQMLCDTTKKETVDVPPDRNSAAASLQPSSSAKLPPRASKSTAATANTSSGQMLIGKESNKHVPPPQQTVDDKQLLLQFPEVADQEVGKGTLLFPSHVIHRPIARTASSDSPILLDSYQPPATDNRALLLTPRLRDMKKSAQHLDIASYGAIISDQQRVQMPGGAMLNNTTAGGNPPDNNNQKPQQQQQEQPLLGEQLHFEGHDFYYGNPDYHDPYAPTSSFHPHSRSSHHHTSPLLGRIASCIWSPIMSCLRDVCQSEAMHRSLCFGAIDGMLTGSGIVATFCGMQLLDNPHSVDSHRLRTCVVLFSAAACFADSVCMALGHIWTTHVLASAHARERGEARQQLENSKAAKGQLVDMLLAKGMLKIDAMSLADTLEGYPDLFLAAIMGEALVTASEVSSQQQQVATAQTAAAANPPYSDNTPPASTHAYPSYGRLMEYEMDPDMVAVRTATKESRKESFFMMLGFSIFAILPSLLFQWVPILIQEPVNTSGSLATKSASTAVHPTSLILVAMACIMWLLGVWKSHFLDSNWMLFGVEAVLVLFLCIAAAYLVGWGLQAFFLPEGVKLQLVKKDFTGPY